MSSVEQQRELDVLDRELGTTLGALNGATAAVIALLARVLEHRVWELQDARRPEHWVAVRFAMSRARAARLVRIAARIDDFPRVAEAFANGQLTEDHLDVIVQHAHRTHDAALATAGWWTTDQLRRIIRGLDTPNGELDDDEGPADAEAPPAVEDRDVVAIGWCDDGRLRGRIDLGPELGSLFDQALQSARAALWRERAGDDPDDDAALQTITTVAAADRLLHAALDGLDPASATGRAPSLRHQILVHVDAERPSSARLDLGPLLGRTDFRLLSCDAELRAVLEIGKRPVGLGRRRRVVDPLLRSLITDRDGGCRVPGCHRTAWLHIHHLVHWIHGGPTDPDNLVALCPDHHRDVHHQRLRIVGDPTRPDGLVFLDTRGKPTVGPTPGAAPTRPTAADPYRGPDRSERLRRQ